MIVRLHHFDGNTYDHSAGKTFEAARKSADEATLYKGEAIEVLDSGGSSLYFREADHDAFDMKASQQAKKEKAAA